MPGVTRERERERGRNEEKEKEKEMEGEGEERRETIKPSTRLEPIGEATTKLRGTNLTQQTFVQRMHETGLTKYKRVRRKQQARARNNVNVFTLIYLMQMQMPSATAVCIFSLLQFNFKKGDLRHIFSSGFNPIIRMP